MNPRIVGRSDTAESGKPETCIHCGNPFKYGINVFTQAGMKEISISGMCEACFDGLFNEDGDVPQDEIDGLFNEDGDVPQDESPYCDCCYSHGIEEKDFNQCDSCGKPIYPNED